MTPIADLDLILISIRIIAAIPFLIFGIRNLVRWKTNGQLMIVRRAVTLVSLAAGLHLMATTGARLSNYFGLSLRTSYIWQYALILIALFVATIAWWAFYKLNHLK